MYINKVWLYGNLTRDPELKTTPTGMNVCSFSLATNRTYVDKNGGKQEEVQFHNVVAWGKQADTIARYMKKGSPVFVEGRIQTRSWEDKNGGGKRFATEVVLENFQFGPKLAGAAGTGGAAPFGGSPSTASYAAPAAASFAASAAPEMDTIVYPSDDVNVDDIPF
jgi:single-strand DNA-binding protein